MESYNADECIVQLQSLLNTESQINSVNHVLNRLIVLMSSSETRDDLQSDHWKTVAQLAKSTTEILVKNEHSGDELELFIRFLRFLRNSCAGSLENHSYVFRTPAIYKFVTEALQHFLHKKKNSECEKILTIAAQVLGNIVLCIPDSIPIVWSLFCEGNKFRHLLEIKNKGIRDCIMIILWMCMSKENCKYLFTTTEGHNILDCIAELTGIDTLAEHDTVIYYSLDNAALADGFLDLSPTSRSIIVKAMDIHFNSERNRNKDLGIMDNVKNLFVKCLPNIKSIKLEPCEINTIISITSKASVMESYRPLLLSSRDLMQACVETLKILHTLGKKDSVNFTAKDDPNYHGIKGKLVKLIGNLCYNCKENQDLVRHLDGIPLVLDCTKVDPENPFIREWCIFAIRNLLSNNLENQAVVKGISTHVDDSSNT